MNQPLVVLLPGRDRRVLGASTRTRNRRVAERMGALIVAPETLAGYGQRPAVLVPAETLINANLFPLPPMATPTSIAGDDGARVVGGPASQMQQYVAGLPADGAIPDHPAAGAAVLDVSTSSARRQSAWTVLLGTGKPSDGWVSRNCTRPLSRPISFVMLWLGFKANHASILTLMVGLGAALLALQPGYLPLVGTGILFQFASVLDGVDGEMARATLSESQAGALIDTIVDQVTYVACFIGVTVGWIREGAGSSALVWMAALSAALVLSLLRGGRFVSRYAPNASFVFIDKAVRRAAHDSGRAALRMAAAMFTLLRRDAFATLFFFVALAGRRALIPALVAFGILLANITLSRYRRELAAAAIALEAGR